RPEPRDRCVPGRASHLQSPAGTVSWAPAVRSARKVGMTSTPDTASETAPFDTTAPESATPLNPLDEGGVHAATDEALAAVAAAGTLDELKAVRLAHAGDRSPLALAN